MKHLLSIAMIVWSAGALAQDTTSTKSSAAPASPAAELKKWSTEFSEAWSRNDYEKLSSFFAEDADILDPFGTHPQGREEIAAFVKQTHETVMKGSKYEIQSVNVRVVTPDVAIVDWEVDLTGMQGGPANGELKHHNTWVMHKVNGQWQAVASRPQAQLPKPRARKSAD